MGEVYLAEDTRLRRKVAIKVLPAAHTLDVARKARFLTEARAASALNHPNIVTIFDVGTEGQTDFIVMEYVEGRTLRTVLTERPPALRDALEIAAHVASGLAAAHTCGIVHRDIKPENIMIGAAGTPKILDYGLAKLLEVSIDAPTAELRALTAPGALVGTVSYMSPEQVETQMVDHRSDIFSLGVVLCEMLSGRNPFASRSITETLQRITHSPPPIDDIARDVPARVKEIVRRMLAAKPAERYQCARDVELDLRAAMSAPAETEAVLPSRHPPGRRRALIAVGCVASALAGAGAATYLAPSPAVAPPRISFMSLTKDPGYEGEPTFSPDGQTIAYVSDRTGNFEIFLKQIGGGPDINLTNDPGDDVQPSFSPDGKQIAFVSTRSSVLPLVYRNPNIDAMGGDIWVMPALGGSPKRVAEDGNFPDWSSDGASIAFVRGPWSAQKIYRAPAGGGKEEIIPIVLTAEPLFLTTPRHSPDGRWLAFSTHQPNEIAVVATRGGKAVTLAEGRHAAWEPDSRGIIYTDLTPGRNGTLSAVRIDGEGRIAGISTPITSGRGEDRTPVVSRDGRTVLFASQSVSFNIERIAFDAEEGKTVGAPEPITRGGDFSPFFSVSPDDRSVVFGSQRGLNQTLWRQEIGSGALTQLAGDDAWRYGQPEWSPDGKQIAYVRTTTGGVGETWVMRSDGGNARKILDSGGFVSWSPDSRSIAFYDFGARVVKALELSTGAVRVLATEGTIRTLHKFSPDGNWMVYQAIGKRGMSEVRVVAAGSTKSRVLVESVMETGHPFFSPDGRWVYFQHHHKNIFRIPGPAQEWRTAPPQQVTFFPESNLYLEQPQMSLNGKYLYFSRRNATSDLWSARFEEKARR
jgi:eukaryotic-like serine/threonine-protein kinase